jgi:hypothetical protein
VLAWEPTVDEMIADLKTWESPLSPEVLEAIESAHGHGEVLDLDLRAVLRAQDALDLGMEWEDTLRSSFYTPGDQQLQEDASTVLDWLGGRGA